MCLYSISLLHSEMQLNDKVIYCNELGIKPSMVNHSPILNAQNIAVGQSIKPFFSILLDDRAGLSASYNILKTTLIELGLI